MVGYLPKKKSISFVKVRMVIRRLLATAEFVVQKATARLSEA